MSIFSIDIAILLLILFTINFIGLALIRSDERFWLPSTALWVLLITGYFINGAVNRSTASAREIEYKDRPLLNPGEYENAEAEWEVALTHMKQGQKAIQRLIGLQTFLCFLSQLLGYRLTNKPAFKKGSLSFLLLFLFYIFWELVQARHVSIF